MNSINNNSYQSLSINKSFLSSKKNTSLTFGNDVADQKKINNDINYVKRNLKIDNLFMSAVSASLLFLYIRQKEINSEIMKLKEPTQKLIKDISEKVSKDYGLINKKTGGYLGGLLVAVLIIPDLLKFTLNKSVNAIFPLKKD